MRRLDGHEFVDHAGDTTTGRNTYNGVTTNSGYDRRRDRRWSCGAC
jgi:hypothetical protein